MDFKNWISEFISVDQPIGDLANDIVSDESFPNSSEYDVLLEYLQSRTSWNAVIDTFKSAFKLYKDDARA